MTKTDEDAQPFKGCKIAVIHGDKVLAYKRDERPEIPFPGLWDLPGGGREGHETPEACVLRELEEEFSIRLNPGRLCYKHRYGGSRGAAVAYFFVAHASVDDIASICFGDEGQCWKLMTIGEFLIHPLGVQHLKSRLSQYLASNQAQAAGVATASRFRPT
ncbi:MAG: NUDIX hydrolase [Gammaproteobacteria bacterium]